MHIKSLRIENYKSFWDSGEIPLERGFNLVVGQNDAGKSALLEALQGGMDSKPHRSLLTAPEMQSPPVPGSKSSKEFCLTALDLRTYLSRLKQVAVPSDTGNYSEAKQHLDDVLAGGGVMSATWRDRSFQSAWMLPPGRDLPSTMVLDNDGWPGDIRIGKHVSNGGNPYAHNIAQYVAEEIYAFRAERYRMGSSLAAGNRVLAADASNLPEVLNKLADDPATERELLGHVMTVFPHITHISSSLEATMRTCEFGLIPSHREGEILRSHWLTAEMVSDRFWRCYMLLLPQIGPE